MVDNISSNSIGLYLYMVDTFLSKSKDLHFCIPSKSLGLQLYMVDDNPSKIIRLYFNMVNNIPSKSIW